MNYKSFKRLLLGFVILYFIIFSARAVYDLLTLTDIETGDSYNVYYGAEKEARLSSNYASERVVYTAGAAAPSVLDQKYERIANLVAKTVNYDSDMEQFNALIAGHRAVVQSENRRGLSGGRRADFRVGVRPESFDDMQAAVSKIGVLTSSSVTKTDKTYEYRQMLAEKETLERRRAGFEDLKKHGGSIPELLQLEEKIIEVEAQIQRQLIGLGEYSDDNALCTINYTLYEGTEAGTLRKLWNALKWATATYAAIMGLLILSAIAALIFIWCLGHIRRMLADKPAPSARTRGDEPERNNNDEAPERNRKDGQNK